MNKQYHGELQTVARDFIDAVAKVTEDSERDPEFIKVKEACVIARTSRWSIRRWIDQGFIRAYKCGNSIKVNKGSLYAYLQSQEIVPVAVQNKNKPKGGDEI